MPSVSELLSLRGRTALITGGAGHIGSVMANALAELGCRIALVDLSAEDTQKTADAISHRYDVETLALAFDLADTSTLQACPAQVAGELQGLDIIIHCAAFVGTTALEGWCVPFPQQSLETWRACFEVNLTSAMALVQSAAPFLKKSGHGSIITVGSIYEHLGPDLRLYEGTSMGNPAAYAASKGGLMQLTRWLSTVLAPDVRVNSISPGGVWRSQPEIFVERYCSRTPLQRMAREDDFIGAAVYLASDLSAYVTGQHIAVDGGFSVW